MARKSTDVLGELQKAIEEIGPKKAEFLKKQEELSRLSNELGNAQGRLEQLRQELNEAINDEVESVNPPERQGRTSR